MLPEINLREWVLRSEHAPATLFISLLCIALFIGVNLISGFTNLGYEQFGYFQPFEIFEGNYWGLLTANFIHLGLWHLLFNLYWFVPFGSAIEQRIGTPAFLFLILVSGLATTSFQLSFSNAGGHGLSGVVYGLFGFAVMNRNSDEQFKTTLSKGVTQLFIIWLPIGYFLTRMEILNIGNAAHLGGLLAGLICGSFGLDRRRRGFILGLTFGVLFVLFIQISPFTTSYLSYQAYKFHEAGQYDEALFMYRRVLTIDPTNSQAFENIYSIERYQISLLEHRAYDLHKQGQYDEAIQLYRQILDRDSFNEFATGNLNQLEEYLNHPN